MSRKDGSRVMILTHGLYPVPGHTVSGNGIRAWGLAQGLVRNGFEVIYTTPSDTVHPHTPRPEVTLAPYDDKAALHALIQAHRPSVLIIGYWAYMHLIPPDIDIPLVMDLLAPWLLETAFQDTCDLEIESIDYIKCLHRADYYLCCTQRQKAYHTAWLLMSGVGIQDNPLAVIPISADPDQPSDAAVLQARQADHRQTHDRPTVFLYGGVLWPWRAPQEWISALLEILTEDTLGCLQLVTGKYPLHEASSSGPLQLPQGPRYTAVLKQSELLPYDEMERLYLQADVGIELSARNTERELSFSFRVIDYLRCGLPVICNDFLEVADLIRRYDAGWVLDSSDDQAFENTVRRILAQEVDLAQKSRNARQLVREQFNIYQNVQPLVQFCTHPRRRHRSNHFLHSLIQHDQNVHALQTSLGALQTRLEDKDRVSQEQAARIAQLQSQLTDMTASHAQAIAWHETTQAVLYRHFEETRSQLAQWQQIAEERRLSARLRRWGQKLLPLKAPAQRVPEAASAPEPQPPETCLYRASEKKLVLNLHALADNLPLQPVPELLNQGQALYSHQQQGLGRFLAQWNVHGKTILEIGADDAGVLSKLAEQGMSLGLGINNWYWQARDPKTIRVTDRIILSWGDIRSLPLEEASFDFIFTIAAFEHIQSLDVALQEMYRLLKPGGMLYSFHGPVWSSDEGHHLWFEREGVWYRFSEPETVRPILEPYEHLLLDREAMAHKLRRRWDQAAVDDFLYQIYASEHINRYMYSDYLRMFRDSGFELVRLENYGVRDVPPEIKDRLESKYGKENNYGCSTMEVVLQKPAGTAPASATAKLALADVFAPADTSDPAANRAQRVFYAASRLLAVLKKVSGGLQWTYRALVKRLLLPLWRRRGRRNLAVVTRHDVFPVDHGAAAKIYHTARVLSFDYDEVYLITLDREKFYIFRQGQIHEELFPRLLRELWYPTEEFLRAELTSAGIPNTESFLFFPMLDRNFRLRVLYVALQKSVAVYQAEFPAFIDACSWAWRIFGGRRAIVAHNIEFQRITDTYRLPEAAREYMRKYEVTRCNAVEHVITVSHTDSRGLIAAGVNASRISMIPHGVDLESFDLPTPAHLSIRTAYGIAADQIVLIFHGIYGYAPNGEAAALIGSRILPALNARGYFPKCLAVGKYPPAQSNHQDLIYTDVVAHVAPYIKTADIAVVPLMDGGGTRMKILEYFAAAIPVVATSKGAEGIDVTPGREIIIADDLNGLIDEVIHLIDQPARRQQIGSAGRKYVEQFSWRNIGKRYVELYQS